MATQQKAKPRKPKLVSAPPPVRNTRRSAAEQPEKRARAARAATETTTMAAAAAVSPDKPLTERQRKFALEWAQGNTIPAAMARAGFSVADHSLGYRLAKMPNVLRFYNAEKAKFEEAAQMSRKKVMDGLLESIEMAKLMAEPASMISGWREIGKMCGYYEPKKVRVDVNVAGNVIHTRINSMSDAELLKIIQGGGAGGLLEDPSEGPDSAPGDENDDDPGV